ncbi:MAG: hypothetical protein NZ561_12105, partial [Phycisphaerae bacterium]|nr:hypothetical protein [Phycisphaerae bacterium]
MRLTCLPVVLLVLVARIATFAAAGAPTTRPISGPEDQPLLFHLPGIGGHRLPDVTLTRGLLAGGLEAEI